MSVDLKSPLDTDFLHAAISILAYDCARVSRLQERRQQGQGKLPLVVQFG